MKKLILLLLASLLLCACVQTPETEFVVNKGDNSVEEKMSSTAESSAQTFPAHWQEDPYTVNDYLSVSIDAEILQKTDGLYPVYRTRSAEISPEEALKYVNALLPAPTSVSGMEMTKEEVDEFCLKLPRYKRPRAVIFADIPRNPTGKIEKPKLREIYGASKLIADQNMG